MPQASLNTQSASSVVSTNQWKSDRLASACTSCCRPFNLFRRKHHCRVCGHIFCDACTRQHLVENNRPQRVCTLCVSKVKPSKEDVPRSEAGCNTLSNHGAAGSSSGSGGTSKETAPSRNMSGSDGMAGLVVPHGIAGGKDYTRQAMKSSKIVRERRITLLGSPGVGKTRITSQFVSHAAPPMYVPTIAQTYRHHVRKGDSIYDLVLSDTAGQSAFDLYQPSLSIGTHVYVIVYSILERSTFQDAEAIHRKVLECHPMDALVMLVGTKKDLLEQPSQHHRAVGVKEGEALARKFGPYPFLEISATKQEDVDEVFHQIIKALIQRDEVEAQRLSAESVMHDTKELSEVEVLLQVDWTSRP